MVDSAFDGARLLVEFQRQILKANAAVPTAHRLRVRTGMHWGPALTDGTHVSGESVHTAARISASAGAGEIRLSNDAFRELPVALRLDCHRLEAANFKGLAAPVEVLLLDWRNQDVFPTKIEIVEAGRVEVMPFKDRVTFGRLVEFEGQPANDIVLEHPDPSVAKRISRWYFVVEMTAEGSVLRPLTNATIEIDGEPVVSGETAPIRPGSEVLLAGVLTLRFLRTSTEVDATQLEG